MHTIMLLDDHEMVRQGIELGLRKETDLDVIGSFSTSRALLDALTQRPADVVVMDFTLGPSDIDGLSLIQMLSRRFKRCKVLVVSSHCTRARVTLALKAGSLGVLGKTQQLTELVVAIRTVAQGRIYLQRCMLSVLQEGESALRQMNIESKLETAMPLRLSGALTPKEQEVLRCFLDGMSVN